MGSVGETGVADARFCQHCLGLLVWDQENTERVCTGCGAVSEAEVDVFEQSSLHGASRPPSATLAEGIGVSTTMGYRDVDAGGRRLGGGRDLRQLRKLNTMVSWDSKRRRLGKVSMEIQRVVRALGLNRALGERAFRIYLKEFSAKSVRTRSQAAVAVACVCLACRQMDVARPPNDLVAKRTEVDEKKFRRYYRMLLTNGEASSVPAPASYVSSVTARASLPATTERAAIEILNRVKGDPRLVGKRPVSLAAAAVYLASVESGSGTTQLRLAYAAGVTPITIRKRSLELSEILASRPTD